MKAPGLAFFVYKKIGVWKRWRIAKKITSAIL
jgi:hypothetical protein